MSTETLEAITRAEAEAQDAAAKATAAAEVARAKAEQARQRAERERQDANQRFLDVLIGEYESARTVAVTALGEARQALEDTVLGDRDGDAFASYRAYAQASVEVWRIESALAGQRHYLGLPTREPSQPVFSFQRDVGEIIDGYALRAMDDAIAANQDRKTRFLSGKERS
jgi:multidrug efflux pump subunit AcrA (membrane-fusion protein)